MNGDVEGQIDLCGAPQGFAEDLRLDFELMFVARVLVVTAATLDEVGAVRLNSTRRGLDDRIYSCASESGFLLRERGFDFFSSEDKRDEHGFTLSVIVGGQAGQPVATVDELFNC